MTAPSPTTAPTSAEQVRQAARASGTSVVGQLVAWLQGPLGGAGEVGERHTLLAVCPVSETVTRAALQAAQEAQAPLLYAATLNQVDRDGGYTGWTPHALADFVTAEAERLDVTVPIVLGLDHGGPWKKDAHARNGWSYDETWDALKASIAACIDAGYELLHLDPTEDRRLPPEQPVPVEAIVERTAALLAFAETERQARERGPIAYEVGTEEVGGGLQSEERMCTFLQQLRDALDRHDLPRPSFVVGDVGTRLDTRHFNALRARRLTTEAQKQIGALLKGHYTDAVDHLAAYPLSGMGGANVGPGLSAAEYDALADLQALEDRLNKDAGFGDALRTAVIESGRWRKWLHPEEEGLPFDALPADRQRWLVRTGSRYVWTDPAVESARRDLYAHVAPYRDADAFVHWRVQTAILRYLHAFNLVGFLDRLAPLLDDAR